jgi:thioredoxin reductase (NADPH)
VAALAGLPYVTLVPNADVIAVEGAENVTALRVRAADGSERSVACEGVFVCAGLQADSGFLAELVERDGEDRIRTDDQHRTSTPGVFAAGDIRAGAAYLLADAAREGEAAAQSAVRYLNETRQT